MVYYILPYVINLLVVNCIYLFLCMEIYTSIDIIRKLSNILGLI